MAETASAPAQSNERPKHWDKMVSAAYLRIMGATQKEAARAVGRTERTIRGWESDPLWPQARAEAEGRWLVDVKDASRQAVLKNVRAGNAMLGMQILERVEPALAPPKQKHEHAGEDGGPIEIVVTRRVVRPDGGD